MHTGQWTTREKSKNRNQIGAWCMVGAAVVGWWMGKDPGFAGTLVSTAFLLIGAVEANHTYQKRKHDEAPH